MSFAPCTASTALRQLQYVAGSVMPPCCRGKDLTISLPFCRILQDLSGEIAHPGPAVDVDHVVFQVATLRIDSPEDTQFRQARGQPNQKVAERGHLPCVDHRRFHVVLPNEIRCTVMVCQGTIACNIRVVWWAALFLLPFPRPSWSSSVLLLDRSRLLGLRPSRSCLPMPPGNLLPRWRLPLAQ